VAKIKDRLVQRRDDQEDKVREKLEEYHAVYDHVGELFDAPVKVDGNLTLEEMLQSVSKFLSNLQKIKPGQSKRNIQGNGIEGNRPSHEKRDELEESRMREEDNNPV